MAEENEDQGSLLDLIQRRNSFTNTASSILNKAMKENRGLSVAEEHDYDGLVAKADRLAQTIKRIEENEGVVRSINDIGSHIDSNGNHRGGNARNEGEYRSYAFDEAISEGRSDLSFGKFVRGLVSGRWDGADNERRALSEGTASAGGVLVPTPLSAQFIDLARARMISGKAGVRTVPMDSATLTLARATADPSTTWKAEYAAASIGNPTFDKVTLTAKTVMAVVSSSLELINDAPNSAQLIEAMLAQALAHALDKAVLFGTGADNEPTGIFNTAGINTVSMGTNGAAVTNYTQILQALKLIAAANFDKSKAVAALHPNIAYEYDSLTNSQGDAMRKPSALNNFQMLESTAVPVNQTQGTANGTASSIIVGQFDQCLLGTRQQITIEVSRSGYDGSGDVFLKNGVLIRCVGRFDVQLAQPKAFTAITGVL